MKDLVDIIMTVLLFIAVIVLICIGTFFPNSGAAEVLNMPLSKVPVGVAANFYIVVLLFIITRKN